MKRTLALTAATLTTAVAATSANAALITEIHYDNVGGDVGETVEFVLGPGQDIANVTIELVNGSGGAVYDTISDFTEGESADGFTVYTATPSSIQNGPPDGIALVLDGVLVEFLSYEGVFTATSGAASGVTSTDIGVSEGSGTPIGSSLSLTDDGFQAPAPNSFGQFNPGLTIPEPGSLALLGLGGLLVARRRKG